MDFGDHNLPLFTEAMEIASSNQTCMISLTTHNQEEATFYTNCGYILADIDPITHLPGDLDAAHRGIKWTIAETGRSSIECCCKLESLVKVDNIAYFFMK